MAGRKGLDTPILQCVSWDCKTMASGGKFFSKLPQDREKEKMGCAGEKKGFFLPKTGTTPQMKIMCLEGCDKTEEKIAHDAREAASSADPHYAPVSWRHCFLLIEKTQHMKQKLSLKHGL